MQKIGLTPRELYTVKAKPFGRMGFLLLCFFPIFFANPVVGVIDILPDFIGYIFMLITLSKLRDVSDKFEDAFKHIAIAALISVAQLASLFLSFGVISGGEGGYQSSFMMFSLVITSLEFIFTIRAVRKFFSAMQYVAERHDCSFVCAPKPRRAGSKRKPRIVSRNDSFMNFTTVFIIIRGLCATLPQFATQSSHGFDETTFDFSRFLPIFQLLGIFVCSIFSVIWIVRAYAYFGGLYRQKEFAESLKKTYSETVVTVPVRFILRNNSLFVLLFSAAAYFGVDFYINDKMLNVIPDALFAIVCIFTLLILNEYFKYSGKLRWISIAIFAAYGIVSFIKDRIHYSYFYEFTMFSYYRDPKAYELYTRLTAVNIFSAILLLASVIMICKLIKYVEKSYAISKFNLENDKIREMNKIESKEFLQSYSTPVLVSGVIASIVTALYPYVLKLAAITFAGVNDETMKLVGTIVGFTEGYLSLDFIVSLVFAILLTRALSELKDRIATKLMLD
jgi:hypothetical protein